jgi:sigma-70-like protein
MSVDGGEDEFDDETPTTEIPRVPGPAAPPERSRAVRLVRRETRRTRPRSKTFALKRIRADLNRTARSPVAIEAAPLDAVDEVDDGESGFAIDRPRTRAECRDQPRPCPWVSCKHHLYLDINPHTGSIKLNFPDLEPWELQHTCALDVAEAGGHTLADVGDITNLTRERVRQLEVRGLMKLKDPARALV